MAGAGGNLQNLGNALRSAYSAAASPTTAIAAPATDEVSTAITSLLGAHAQEFQAISAKAQVFHDDFANLLNGGAAQYLNTELTNAQQTLANAVNAPGQTLAAAAAPVTTPTNQAFNFAFGPFALSGTQTFDPATGTGATNAAFTLNALGHSVPLFTVSGSESISQTTGLLSANFSATGPLFGASASGTLDGTTGAFGGTFAEHAPLFWGGGAVNGVVPLTGTGAPQLTGLALNVYGIPLPTHALIGLLNGLLQSVPIGSPTG